MKRFIELTVRKGSTLASLERHNPEDLHVVLEAFLTYLPDDLISASTALTKAQEFLDGAGDWLRETPVSILLQSLKKGLIFEATVGYRKNSRDRYTRAQLEDAVLLEEERRETLRSVMQKALQKRNREINSKKRQTSPYDQQFMHEALEFAREAAYAGEVPVGCVIVKDGAKILYELAAFLQGVLRRRIRRNVRIRLKNILPVVIQAKVGKILAVQNGI